MWCSTDKEVGLYFNSVVILVSSFSYVLLECDMEHLVGESFGMSVDNETYLLVSK